MPDVDPLLRARESARPVVEHRLTVLYDDRPIAATTRDTVSSALLAAGIVATGRSLKYRRARGPFCLQGDCGTCLVRIDGVPNRRACTTVAREGMRIEPQNRLIAGAPDPTALVDHVFTSSLDHHHLMLRPRVLNRVMQEVARNLAGFGTVPDHAPPPARWTEHRPHVVVVGAGRAGLAVTRRLRAAGMAVECLERFDGGVSTTRTHARYDTAVFGIYPGERRVAAVQSDSEVHVLRTFTPAHVVIATGAREVMLPMRNNDLPGVLAARGLAALLDRSGTELACAAVVVGVPAHAEPLAMRLGIAAVDIADVRALLGRGRVERIATGGGKREVSCVALASAPAPASELARQAGASVVWTDDGFAVSRDADGRCGGGPWTLWACGEVCGLPRAEAEADGDRIAASILAATSSTTSGTRR